MPDRPTVLTQAAEAALRAIRDGAHREDAVLRACALARRDHDVNLSYHEVVDHLRVVSQRRS
jgi:hypothetical protein